MWIECVPNVSEGRRPDAVADFRAAIRSTGAHVLHVSADAAHNRSVYTFAGSSATVERAALALFDRAIASIDLRTHRGEHPRIGAVDVVPFVPLDQATMADCVLLARRVAARVAEQHDLPVYLYEEAAIRPDRRRLEHIRRGGFEGLAAKMREPGWGPDFGPPTPHPSAGASVIGARSILIAYNVTLATDRLEAANTIARAIRESSGGLPSVKAMGVPLVERGIVQVSMNLTNYRETSILDVFEAITRHAARLGVEVLDSELIGLAPAAALSAEVAARVRLQDFGEDRIIETQLRALQHDQR